MTLGCCETQQLGKEENMTVGPAGILVPSCELGATERGRIFEQTPRGAERFCAEQGLSLTKLQI